MDDKRESNGEVTGDVTQTCGLVTPLFIFYFIFTFYFYYQTSGFRKGEKRVG